jgi:hypothetical protein
MGEALEFDSGTFFFHGSPYLFDQMAEGSFFSNNPELSLAILTEKCSEFGYFYEYRCDKKVSLEERDPLSIPNAIWFSEPVYNYDDLVKRGEDARDKIIASSDNGYFEFLYRNDLGFKLVRIHKIDVNLVREIATENFLKGPSRYQQDKLISIDTETKIVKEFLPHLIVRDLRGY